jgi:nucleotide-binding universal stress UspA family protein
VTLVVGYAPEGRSRAALHFAGSLARSAGEEVVVCAVVPVPWPPGPARVDAEYRDHLEHAAQEALEEARARLPADLDADFVVEHARSAPAGLLDVAEARQAEAVVVGSSSVGALGRVSLGSASNRLVHSSPIPVALAPRGYRCAPDMRVRRVTAAFGGSAGADDLAVAAAGLAARLGASLRLASFAVRPRAPYTAGVGRIGDEAAVEEWAEAIRGAADTALADVREHVPHAPDELDAVIGRGETWDEAIEDVEWGDGDFLVVGSSSIGPLRRVFLGSRASKIVRRSPVPVAVVPRGAAAELAERAEHA